MNSSTPQSGPQLERPQWRQILTIAAILGTFGINVWSNLFPLYGQTIGDISNTLFASVQVIPANYAFAIWGLIYLGLFALGIYQLLPAQRQNADLSRIDYWLVLACVAQAVWVFLFLSQLFWLSVLAMLGILLPLMAIYLQLNVGRRRVSRSQKWLVHIPISIYFGWITVATVVNVASALYSSGWTGGGISATVWTIVLVIVSAIIGAVSAIQRRDVAFTLVIVWALVAIGVRQLATPAIAVTAIGLAIALVLILIVNQVRSRHSHAAVSDLDRASIPERRT